MAGLALDAVFWRGRRVFLTGHTGFKGSWLSLWLQAMGAEVHGYALSAPTEPNLFDVCEVASGMARSTIADIRDAGALAQALQTASPEIVFHLAAQSIVRQGYAEPFETYSVNVLGTASLLEAVRGIDSVRAVVNVTSDKCYENREWVWGYRENEPMGGFDPYSSSKACAELVTAAYRRSYLGPAGVALASARAGNVLGGGDWARDRLVPDVLRAFERHEPVCIRNASAIRPWQHVLEPLSGYLCLAQALSAEHGRRFAEAWNFGPLETDARPVRFLVERLVGLWGGGASWVQDDGPQPHEASSLNLDCSKARAVLGWHPRWTLEEALHRIVEWHRAYLEGRDMRHLTRSQIRSYQALHEVA